LSMGAFRRRRAELTRLSGLLCALEAFAELTDGRHQGERRDDRQPEVEQSIDDDAEQSRREAEPHPDERKGEGDLDDAGAAGGKRTSREDVG
jgi:hypothetical protein